MTAHTKGSCPNCESFLTTTKFALKLCLFLIDKRFTILISLISRNVRFEPCWYFFGKKNVQSESCWYFSGQRTIFYDQMFFFPRGYAWIENITSYDSSRFIAIVENATIMKHFKSGVDGVLNCVWALTIGQHQWTRPELIFSVHGLRIGSTFVRAKISFIASNRHQISRLYWFLYRQD